MNIRSYAWRRLTRREALAWVGMATAWVWVQPCRCGHAQEQGASSEAESQTAPKIANLMALRNGSALGLARPRVILVRTVRGIAAFPRICTHRYTPLNVKAGAIFCPLHGSRFDLTGKPVNGPATRPLRWLKTTVDDDGNIRVHESETVPRGTWARLPAWAQKASSAEPGPPSER